MDLSASETETLRGSGILVTGGAGFIGSHLVKRLCKLTPKRVVALDNFSLRRIGGMQRGLEILADVEGKYKLVVGDASNYKFVSSLLRKEKLDVAFNLATFNLPFSLRRPKYVFDHNTKIASVMAELSRREEVKMLVHFSSSEVYGTAKYVPMDEDHPLEPSTSYGASKAAQDLLLQSYYMTYGVDVRIVRPFNNIGPAQNDTSYSAVVPKTIRHILRGEVPEIYGDGLQTRDFTYVEDTVLAAIMAACIDKAKGKVINIASGQETTILRLVETISSLMGYRGRISFLPSRAGDLRRHYAKTEEMRKVLGIRSVTSLRSALEKTISWYSSHTGA